MSRWKMRIPNGAAGYLFWLAFWTSWFGGKPGQCDTDVMPACTFPSAWQGDWFWQGESDDGQQLPLPRLVGDRADRADRDEVFVITNNTFGSRGICVERGEGDKHVVYDRNHDCYRCLQIFDRSPNVLQFQQGVCHPSSRRDRSGQIVEVSEDEEDEKSGEEGDFSLETLCSKMSSENVELETLVRIGAGDDIECPFVGQYKFSYTEGQRSCQNPLSTLETCMATSLVAFRFQDCPELQQTPSKGITMIASFVLERKETGVETLTCRGNWTDGHLNYLVGHLEHPYSNRLSDKVRCFLYKRTGDGGFRLAQSRDAGCKKLKRMQDGERQFILKKVHPPDEASSDHSSQNKPHSGRRRHGHGLIGGGGRPACLFPDWAASVGGQAQKLLSFSYTSQYEFSPDLAKMIVSNYSSISGQAFQTSLTECLRIEEEMEGKYVRMLTRVTGGCESRYKCISLHWRSEDILEIQEGRLTLDEDQACSPINMDEQWLPFTTLLSADEPLRACTANGHHNVTSLNLKGSTEQCREGGGGGGGGGFKEVFIRCNEDSTVEFLQECNNVRKDSIFDCMGGWEEEVPYDSLPGAGAGAGADGSLDYGGGTYGGGTGGGGGGVGSSGRWSVNDNTNNNNYYSLNNNLDNEEDTAYDLPENVTLGYMIARSRHTKGRDKGNGGGGGGGGGGRVCFIYTSLNDTFYSWTVDTTACLRNIRPGQFGKFKFTTTKLEPCCASHPALLANLTLWLSLLFSRSL